MRNHRPELRRGSTVDHHLLLGQPTLILPSSAIGKIINLALLVIDMNFDELVVATSFTSIIMSNHKCSQAQPISNSIDFNVRDGAKGDWVDRWKHHQTMGVLANHKPYSEISKSFRTIPKDSLASDFEASADDTFR